MSRTLSSEVKKNKTRKARDNVDKNEYSEWIVKAREDIEN